MARIFLVLCHPKAHGLAVFALARGRGDGGQSRSELDVSAGESFIYSIFDQLGDACEVELFHELASMPLDCLAAEMELFCDVFCGFALGD